MARAEATPCMEGDDPGLPAELLRQVRRVEVRARRLVTGPLGGDYRSVFHGAGIEFAEAREYVPGDDVRLIDWNVTARMGETWVKEYVEERELAVICAVDVSASQLVARQPGGRRAVAAEVTALLALAAAQQRDRAGLLTFSDRVERYVPPAHGARHALRLVREVLRPPESRAGTALAHACEHLGRVLHRRSAVFLISDFLDRGYEQALRALARRHEVVAIVLSDPHDAALPDLGIVEVEDAESGERMLLDSSDPALRWRYAALAAERDGARRHALATAGVEAIEIQLDGSDPLDPIVAYFRRRALRSHEATHLRRGRIGAAG